MEILIKHITWSRWFTCRTCQMYFHNKSVSVSE